MLSFTRRLIRRFQRRIVRDVRLAYSENTIPPWKRREPKPPSFRKDLTILTIFAGLSLAMFW